MSERVNTIVIIVARGKLTQVEWLIKENRDKNNKVISSSVHEYLQRNFFLVTHKIAHILSELHLSYLSLSIALFFLGNEKTSQDKTEKAKIWCKIIII